jgi:hypothetical protein
MVASEMQRRAKLLEEKLAQQQQKAANVRRKSAASIQAIIDGDGLKLPSEKVPEMELTSITEDTSSSTGSSESSDCDSMPPLDESEEERERIACEETGTVLDTSAKSSKAEDVVLLEADAKLFVEVGSTEAPDELYEMGSTTPRTNAEDNRKHSYSKDLEDLLPRFLMLRVREE